MLQDSKAFSGFAVDDLDVTFERYEGMPQEPNGVMKSGGPDVAWFKDPAGNFLKNMLRGCADSELAHARLGVFFWWKSKSDRGVGREVCNLQSLQEIFVRIS